MGRKNKLIIWRGGRETWRFVRAHWSTPESRQWSFSGVFLLIFCVSIFLRWTTFTICNIICNVETMKGNKWLLSILSHTKKDTDLVDFVDWSLKVIKMMLFPIHEKLLSCFLKIKMEMYSKASWTRGNSGIRRNEDCTWKKNHWPF